MSSSHYWSVSQKFAIAACAAGAWCALSGWFAIGWIKELGTLASLPAAILVISCIALLPGFMNMFLSASLLIDRRPKQQLPAVYPGVSVLVAAYNEQRDINLTVTRLNSALEQDYPGPFEMLVIDDGSTDGTLEALACLHDVPNVRVIKAPHGGKAKALGAGLAQAAHDLIVTVDADTVLHPRAIACLVQRMMSDPPGTAAVAGSVLVNNPLVNAMTRMQDFDYLLAIAAVKRAQSLFQGTLVAQGAFSIYRKDALLSIGGWPETVGEDIVMTWALLERGWRVGYAEDALAYTNVPLTYREFFLQRKRWARGLIEAFKAHPKVLLRPKLITLFIYWNLLFPLLDTIYVFVFMPGVVLALFGHYYIAGPMTLAVLPLSMLNFYIMYRAQKGMLAKQGVPIRQNNSGFLLYTFCYAFAMQPACVAGYFTELTSSRKDWGTK